MRSLVILAAAPARKESDDQLLSEHVGAVEAQAKRIADRLQLAKADPIRMALCIAAKWHDEGKRARIWQVFAKNPDPDGPPLGKMAQSRDPKSLRGYRHEFGSLLRMQYPDRCSTSHCELPENRDARELALHLIAAHHGAGRPHFGHALYDLFVDAERDVVHTECIRRFARLQRKYGWWRLAWLENLLRCADALASADQDAEDDASEPEGRVT
jgi:CRISPR-associated endonuclease/helicase Cas3